MRVRCGGGGGVSNDEKLLDHVSKSNFLERDELPTFTDTELTALKSCTLPGARRAQGGPVECGAQEHAGVSRLLLFKGVLVKAPLRILYQEACFTRDAHGGK